LISSPRTWRRPSPTRQPRLLPRPSRPPQ
jgi:hypothetical protein